MVVDRFEAFLVDMGMAVCGAVDVGMVVVVLDVGMVVVNVRVAVAGSKREGRATRTQCCDLNGYQRQDEGRAGRAADGRWPVVPMPTASARTPTEHGPFVDVRGDALG